MTSRSFSAEERIKDSREFQRIYKNGKKIITDYFVWFFCVDKSLKKLGITITKEVGTASERNRIRRQVREFFRLNKEDLPVGVFVIKARYNASRAENPRIRLDLQKGLTKIKP